VCLTHCWKTRPSWEQPLRAERSLCACLSATFLPPRLFCTACWWLAVLSAPSLAALPPTSFTGDHGGVLQQHSVVPCRWTGLLLRHARCIPSCTRMHSSYICCQTGPFCVRLTQQPGTAVGLGFILSYSAAGGEQGKGCADDCPSHDVLVCCCQVGMCCLGWWLLHCTVTVIVHCLLWLRPAIPRAFTV